MNEPKLWNWDKIGPIQGESDEEWPGRPRNACCYTLNHLKMLKPKGTTGQGGRRSGRLIGLFASPLIRDLIAHGAPRHPGADLDEHPLLPG